MSIQLIKICFFAALFLSVLLFEYTTASFIRSIRSGSKRGKKSCILTAALETGIYFAVIQFHLPLLCLLVLLFIISCWVMRELTQETWIQFWFFTLLRILHISAAYLIFISLASLFFQINLKEAYETPYIWMGTALCVVWSVGILSVLVIRSVPARQIQCLWQDDARLRQLVAFEWFAFAYVLFDSIPGMFEMPYFLFALFLLGSSILILLQNYLFLMRTERLVKDARYEEECRLLEQERAEQIRKEMDLRNLVYVDGLTGLNNRRYAFEILDSLIQDEHGLTVAYIDLNGLKWVNDHFGHIEGDEYLRKTAAVLNESLSANDTIARIGGDEFLVIAPNASEEELRRILKMAGEKLMKTGMDQFTPSFSFGLAHVCEGKKVTAVELLRSADVLMYQQKRELYAGKEV